MFCIRTDCRPFIIMLLLWIWRYINMIFVSWRMVFLEICLFRKKALTYSTHRSLAYFVSPLDKTQHVVRWLVCCQITLIRLYSGAGGSGAQGGGVLPSNGLLLMCRWMGSDFHVWTGYNVVGFSGVFNRVTRMGLHFFGTLGLGKSFTKKWLSSIIDLKIEQK